MSSIVAVAWQRYLKQLEAKPLRTKAVTAACISGISDVIAQRIGSNAPLNWRRTLAMALFGLVWSGPSNHYWQQLMERTFKGQKSSATIVEKVALDQLLYGPVCNVLMMSYISMVVDGRSAQFTRNKLQRDYPGVQVNGWKLWPLASLVNYRFVPLKLRVLFVNIVALFWSTFLISRTKSANQLLRIKGA